MITHSVLNKRTSRATCLGLMAVCWNLSFTNAAWADTLLPDCYAFTQPFDACFERAGQLMVQGKLPQAQAIYQLADRQIHTLPPHLQAATALSLARIARWQMQYPQAQARYNAFLQTHPNNTEAMIGLGLIALEEKRLDDSRRWLSQAKQLGDTSTELTLAQQWLSTAWKYQLTIGAQSLHSPSGNSQHPIFTLELAINRELTGRVGLRALDIGQGTASSLSDFAGQARVLELGATYKPSAAHTMGVQYDSVVQQASPASQSRGDYALKLSYDLKQAPVQAAVFFQTAQQNGLNNQELRGDLTLTLNPDWAIKTALNAVRENTQYAHQHAQAGLRLNVSKDAYVQAGLRQSSTQYQQAAPTAHSAIELEVGAKPILNHAVRLTLLADQLASKRQATAAWTYEGQPRMELRHEWIQETAANLRTAQNNTVADISLALTPMLDLKLSLSHQSLAKTTSALGLLVYRWQ